MEMDATMPKVRANPGGQGHLKPALPWKLSFRISFKTSELDLQFLLKTNHSGVSEYVTPFKVHTYTFENKL